MYKTRVLFSGFKGRLKSVSPLACRECHVLDIPQVILLEPFNFPVVSLNEVVVYNSDVWIIDVGIVFLVWVGEEMFPGGE